MITEHLEEQACLYVLGLLPQTEERAFEAEMSHDDELRKLVASLQNATLAIAKSTPMLEISPDVKQRLFASIADESTTAQKSPDKDNHILPFPKKSQSSWLPLVPWAAAAGLTVFLILQMRDADREQQELTAQISSRANELQSAKEELVTASNQWQIEKNRLEASNQASIQAQTELQKQLATAETTRKEILARLTALEAKDALAQAQIAVMNSLIKNRPEAIAVSVWNQEKQNGILVVENLPVLEPGKDYQLWVIDPSIAAPVSAGIFKVDVKGKVRINFQPKQNIQTAAKFAVTEEKEGGAVSPTMDKMVVIGGI